MLQCQVQQCDNVGARLLQGVGPHLCPPAHSVGDYKLIKQGGLDDCPVDALPLYVEPAICSIRPLPQVYPKLWIQVLQGQPSYISLEWWKGVKHDQ